MPKFSGATKARTRSVGPITTAKVADTATYNAAPGFTRDAKSDLFMLAVSNMVGERTFYETTGARDSRFVALVTAVTTEDPVWIVDFATWLRAKANMRSASIVVAATAVKTWLDQQAAWFIAEDTDERSLSRQIIDAVCVRADEPAEFIGYWMTTYGRNIPKPVKRGVADAVKRLYTERNALRYDGETRNLRMADVVELTHPRNTGLEQGALYEYLLSKRHGRKPIDVEAPLPLIAARRHVMDMTPAERRAMVNRGDERLRAAGFSWEALSGWLADGQGMDAMAWEFVIPDMGYMALIRNLRNFDDAAITTPFIDLVKARLTDPDEVARSRQLPFRFYSAFRAVGGTRWLDALETAFGLALANVPALDGHTLVLVDRSGSMFGPTLSEHSNVAWSDASALFGTAIAARAEKATLVQYGSTSREVKFTPIARGGSVLSVLDTFDGLGGTDTRGALQRWFKVGTHTRVVLVTDEQANYHGHKDVFEGIVPESVPATTINLVGYGRSHAASGPNRHFLAGLSDASFTMLPLLEKGISSGWPWEIEAE